MGDYYERTEQKEEFFCTETCLFPGSWNIAGHRKQQL